MHYDPRRHCGYRVNVRGGESQREQRELTNASCGRDRARTHSGRLARVSPCNLDGVSGDCPACGSVEAEPDETIGVKAIAHEQDCG